ncbi:MAG: beta-ketoacyl-ACP synthase 3, partial [Candidatus Kapabacteria bacterium]|nr:beta-ketoacyl-ACP synthase 3 [Candidatus Kapabacteria bacterium]
MLRAAITSVGHYVPETVYPNSYFEQYLETSDAWIVERTGIRERRFACNGATSDLIVPAAQRCLEHRGLTPQDIDCIIVATVTPDYFFPNTAAVVQQKLRATHAWGFDLSAACSGFIYALVVAAKLIEAGVSRRLLLCGADKMSSIVNFEDRATAVLFGDGGGAILLEPSNDLEVGVLDHALYMNGDGGQYLYMPAGGSAKPASVETVRNKEHYVVQEGRTVFKEA